MSRFAKKRFSSGFTLIELLVAIAIIGTLSTIATIAFTSARENSKITRAQADISSIRKSIEMLANDANEWPGHQPNSIVCTDIVPGGCPADNEICGPDTSGDTCTSGLRDASSGLTSNDPVTSYSFWSGPYIDRIPLDPWNHEYFFDTDYMITVDNEPCAGGAGCINAVVIGSYGPDGEGNNEYNADDIIDVVFR